MINVTQTFLPPLEEYSAYLQEVWESKWLTNRGKLVCELEKKLCHYFGIENLLAVNNGTIALQLAIRALGLTGDIITTPFSYVATVSSIVWENCRPVFVDIDPEYLTINESLIEAAISENTSAILATHVYGNPCNVEVIHSLAERHNLKVIYDAAHCFGVNYKEKSILKWGDVSTLSFHATKLFHTGEGGAVVCNDSHLAKKIFTHHNFGHKGEEDFWGLGINGKMSELHAALGLSLLPYIAEIISERKRICETYDCLLQVAGLTKLSLRMGTEWNYAYYPVRFQSESALLVAKAALNAQSIFPRRYFYPSLNHIRYVGDYPCAVADNVSPRVLCLPLYVGLKEIDIENICRIIKGNG